MQPGHHDANNFDFLRVAAAFAVLLSHQYALSGRPEPIVLVGTMGGWGVLVFFAISGYLVAGSWQHDPNLARFGARRLLRIWPGLAVACLLLALVLGPLVSSLGARAYYASPMVRDYLKMLDLWHFKAQLPGIFAGNPLAGQANGSLWTIPIEVACYVALALVGLVGVMRRTALLLTLYGAACVWFFFLFKTGYEDPIRAKLQMGMIFFAGACLYQVRRHWMTRKAIVSALAAVAIPLVWSAGFQELAFTLGLPLAVVLLGAAGTPVLRRCGRYGDFSYGLYIYAYPVQQCVVAAFDNRLSVAAGVALSTLVTLLLAVLSWHLVEKRALGLKVRLVSARTPALPGELPDRPVPSRAGAP